MKAALRVQHLPVSARGDPDVLQVVHVLNVIVPIIGIFDDKRRARGENYLPPWKGGAWCGHAENGKADGLQGDGFRRVEMDAGSVALRQGEVGHL